MNQMMEASSEESKILENQNTSTKSILNAVLFEAESLKASFGRIQLRLATSDRKLQGNPACLNFPPEGHSFHHFNFNGDRSSGQTVKRRAYSNCATHSALSSTSSATDSVSFLLSEPDFRLRRTKGQVRVHFAGSSAKRVAKSGIASGDEVLLSLDGVEWVRDQTRVSTPGNSVEVELRFTEKLLLQFRPENAQEVEVIDIDHPMIEPEHPNPITLPETAPLPQSSLTTTNYASTENHEQQNGEYVFSSPAFVKRARTSYGSLFETDPWAEIDGSVRGSRKRAKVGMRLSSSWRISSRSPTPESDMSAEDSTPPATFESPVKQPIVMTDEGCQTMDMEDDDPTEPSLKLSNTSTDVGSIPYAEFGGSFHSHVPPMAPMFTEIAMQPPAIQTQLTDHGFPGSDGSQQVPRSPRLLPQSSDLLPLVSPRISSKYSILTGQLDHISSPREERDLQEEGNPTQIVAGEGNEDLYAATPLGRHGLETSNETPELSGSSDNHGLMNSDIQEGYIIHGQQFDRNDAAALPSHSSPRQVLGDLPEMRLSGGFEDERTQNESDFESGDVSESGTPIPSLPQYPDLDEIQHQSAIYGWGAPPFAVAYPELAQPLAKLETSSYSAAPRSGPVSAAMSRSQSLQSQVVDLTESDEEVAPDQDGGENEEEEAPFDSSADEEEYEEEYQEDQFVGSLHGYQQAPGDRLASQHSQDLQEHEEYEEEYEEDENGDLIAGVSHGHRANFEEENGEGDEDEEGEGSYDEYEEEEGMEDYQGPSGRHFPKDPVVIDLLSSDDEDVGDPVSNSALPTQRSQVSEEPGDSEESESEDEEDEEIPDANSPRGPLPPSRFWRTAFIEHDSEESDDSEDEEQVSVEPGMPSCDDGDAHESSPESEESDSESIEDPSLDQDVQKEVDDEHAPIAHHQDLLVLEGEDPTTSNADAHPEAPGILTESRSKTQPTATSHVFGSILGLDGANDEPVLSNWDQVFLEHKSSSRSLNSDQTKPRDSNNSMQLPTPDDTQVSNRVFSATASFSTALDSQTSTVIQSSLSQETSKLLHDDLATAGAGEMASEIELSHDIETNIVINQSTSEASLKVEMTASIDVEMSDEPHEQQSTSLAHQIATESDVGDDNAMNEISTQSLAQETDIESDAAIEDDAEASSLSKAEKIAIKSDLTDGEKSIDSVSQEIANESSAADNDAPRDGADTSWKGGVSDEIQGVVTEEPAEGKVPMRSTSPKFAFDDGLEDEITIAETTEEATEMAKDFATNNVDFESNVSKEAVQTGSPTEEAAGEANEQDSETKGAQPKPEDLKLLTDEVKSERSEQPEHVVVTPRRSHRRVKSTTSTVDSKETLKPETPAKTGRKSQASSVKSDRSLPMVVIDDRESPKGHDASAELALSSLSSPSKQHDLRKPPVADLKLRLSRALRTELSEFTALKVLRYHLSQKLDVLAVATSTSEEPQRAKNGPRHYSLTFNITDPSIAPSGVTEVQVFRPYRDALPVVQAGDGVLLRNFSVISVKNRGFALRSEQGEASSWAVFHGDEEADVRGPPVEYGDGEKNHIVQLKAWYGSLDTAAVAKINRANADKGTPGKSSTKAT
ncbi:hypothetical protein G7Y89_g5926 [Cudoniella acicularis]|uniref:Telomeric single stranded DNA binding POT1/Cdc13 domain-containing protein n=1 Tax=Cudoniella acicularis TaxID=354080 RepID=A0A8H4RNP8_9HELO|nr:hypothetical protein G7Y89_g5926 [Cudoniella acicularis]